MTQEEQLLLKDLLGRIPYGLKFKIGDYSDYTLIGVVISDEHPIKVEVTEKDIIYKIEVSVNNVKPYLRPMSSMTEEEEEEFVAFTDTMFRFGKDEELCVLPLDAIDWLNKNMFDYRGLIPKGLAIEVTEENNPYEN